MFKSLWTDGLPDTRMYKTGSNSHRKPCVYLMRCLQFLFAIVVAVVYVPLQAATIDAALFDSSNAFVSEICSISQSISREGSDNAAASRLAQMPDSLPGNFRTALLRSLESLPAAAASDQGAQQETQETTNSGRGFTSVPITRRQGPNTTTIGTRFTWWVTSATNASADEPAEAVSLSVLGANEPVAFVLQVGVLRPQFLLRLNAECQIALQRMVTYDESGRQLALYAVDSSGEQAGSPEWLNPALPEPSKAILDLSSQSEQANTLQVAMIDSGVNYLLPVINDRLARDVNGQLLGYDFWDNDDLPFDAHPTGSPFAVQRHGTRTAGLFLEEAPFATLVPFRYPRGNMHRMAELLQRIEALGITLVGMALGGNNPDDWEVFYQQAQRYPHILFVVSAGNNERNIDDQPVYPAALDLSNMVVVSSADETARPARGSNWGRQHVDYLLPAENIELTDFDGSRTHASGSSYAVSRMLAMLARMVARNPDWRTDELLAELRRQFNDGASARYVTGGYIGDPLSIATVDPLLTLRDSIELDVNLELAVSDVSESAIPVNSKYTLQPNFVVLHESWTPERIQPLIDRLASVIAVCGIELQSVKVSFYDAQPHLKVMSIGAARTLRRELSLQRPTVYLVEQTRILRSPQGELFRFDAEAFGRGNTRYRSWLLDTVWVAANVIDADLAVAHELLHVLMNSGEHNNLAGNLMNATTSPANRHLNPQQCQRAVETGLANGLLQAG